MEDETFNNKFQQQLDQASIESNKQCQHSIILKEPMAVLNDLGGHNFEDIQNDNTVQLEV